MANPFLQYRAPSTASADNPFASYRPDTAAVSTPTTPATPRLQRSWGEAAKDTGVGIVQGAANLLGAAAQTHEMSPQGLAVRFAQEKALGAMGQRRMPIAEINAKANAAIDDWKSPALQESQAALSETKGVLPTLKRLATDPKLIGQFAAEQVPMLATLGTGTAVTASRAGATAAQNALTRGAASNVAERYGGQVGRAMARRFNIGASGGLGAGFSGMGAEADALQQDDATWAKNPEFQRRVAGGENAQAVKDSLAQRAGLTAGAIAGPISAATGGLTARLETDIFTRNMAAAGPRALLTMPGAAQVGSAVAREGAEEALQEGAEQFAQNVGVRMNADRERGLMEGVPEAATIGGTVGAVIGGGMGAGGTALSRPDGMRVQAPEGSLQQAVEQTQARTPMLALPAPVIRVRPDGKAATESTIFQRQQLKQDRQQAEDAELVGERDALGLSTDVNAARSRHPGAAPNAPRLQQSASPPPRPGSLADVVQQENQEAAAAPVANAGMWERQLAERTAAAAAPKAEQAPAMDAPTRPQSPPINLDPESGELLGLDAEAWPNGAAHQQPAAIVDALKAEAASNKNRISGVTRIAETYNVDKAIARQLRQRAIDQMNAEVGSPRRGEEQRQAALADDGADPTPRYDERPEPLDSDITPPSGGSFASRGAADLVASRTDGARVFALDDGTFAVRSPLQEATDAVEPVRSNAATPVNQVPDVADAEVAPVESRPPAAAVSSNATASSDAVDRTGSSGLDDAGSSVRAQTGAVPEPAAVIGDARAADPVAESAGPAEGDRSGAAIRDRSATADALEPDVDPTVAEAAPLAAPGGDDTQSSDVAQSQARDSGEEVPTGTGAAAEARAAPGVDAAPPPTAAAPSGARDPALRPKLRTTTRGKVFQEGHPDTIRAYFQPGALVKAYGNTTDRVLGLDFEPSGAWKARVIRVNSDGSPIAGEVERTHWTIPEQRDLVAAFGRADKLPPAPKKGKAKSSPAPARAATAPPAEAAVASADLDKRSPVEVAGEQAATSDANETPAPTDAQKEAGNYRVGRLQIGPHKISIENPAGTRRRPEWPKLKDSYGYIRQTTGRDGDHVDVFMTKRAHDTSLPVFVVDQVNADGTFDEAKVVMGARNEAEARAVYSRNYSKNWTGLGGITEMSQEAFAEWVRDPAKTKRRADGKPIRPNSNPTAGDKGTSTQPTTSDAASRPVDAGQELWYNRRNRSGAGLQWSDVDGLNDTLKVKEVVKSKVWPRPDYEQLVADGLRPEFAHIVKQIYDTLSTKPQVRGTPTDAQLQAYIETVGKVRDTAFDFVRDPDKMGGVLARLVERATAVSGQQIALADLAAGTETNLLDNIFPKADGERSRWRTNGKVNENNARVLLIGGNKVLKALEVNVPSFRAAMKAVGEGWPAPQEAWQRLYKFRTYSSGIAVSRAGRTIARDLPTQTAADEAAKAHYEQSRRSSDGPLAAEARAVEEAQRTGPAHRRPDEDVSSERLLEVFGFRGVNFGNWMKGDSKAKVRERQLHLNHAYDALMDLSDLTGLPPKALSLEGKLGLAFGAQGSGGRGAAHFVPGVNEINLTRRTGAGGIAHEWAHALDHYFAVQAGDAVARSANPFLTQANLRAREELGVRPEIARAFQKIVNNMRKRPVTQAELDARAEAESKRVTERLDGALTALRTQLPQDDSAALAMFDELADRLRAGDRGEGRMPTGRKVKGLNSRTKVDEEVSQAAAQMLGVLREHAAPIDSVMPRLLEADGLAGYIAMQAAQSAQRSGHLPQTGEVTSTYAREAAALESKSARSRSGPAYWSTPWEMFARAFESYVIDRLAGRQQRSDYLTWPQPSEDGARAMKAAGLLKGDPYPRGAERTRISEGFDTLLGEIKTEKTADGNVRLFSKGDAAGDQRLSFDQALRMKAELTARWGENAPNVILVENAEQFPGFAKLDPDYRRGEGLFNGRNTIWINVGGIRTEQRFAQVLAHEALGHFGVENVVGDQWNGIVRSIAQHDRDGTGAKSLREAMASVHARYGRLDPTTFAKETIAVMAERGTRNGIVDRVVAAVRRWLRQHMPQMTWTAADVVNLLGQADSFLRAGRSVAEHRDSVASMAFSRQLTLSAFLRGAPIAEAGKDAFPRREGVSLRDEVVRFFDAIGGRAESPQLGTVQLGHRGVKSSIAHGIGRPKAAAFLLVPDVIRAGRVVDTTVDYDGPAQDRHVIGAPVRIEGRDYLMAVVVRKQPGQDAAFYLHEVTLSDLKTQEPRQSIKNASGDKRTNIVGAAGAETSLSQAPSPSNAQSPGSPSTARSETRSNVGGSAGAIANLLLDAHAGNRDNLFSLPPVQLQVDGRGERRIEMGGETFLDRAGSFYLVDAKGQPRDFLTLGAATEAALRTGGEIVIDPAEEGRRSTWSVVVPDVVVREAATGRPLFSKAAAEYTSGPDPSRPFAPEQDLNRLRIDKIPLRAHIKGGLDWFKQKAWLPMLPINYLIDYVQEGQTAIAEFMRTRGLMDSYRGELHARFSEISQRWLTGAGKARKGFDEMASLMHDATLAHVDPSKETSDPLQFIYGDRNTKREATPENVKAAVKELKKQIRGMSGQANPDLYARINAIEAMGAAETKRPERHAALRERFLALPAEARKTFTEARDSYQQLSEEWDEVLLESIEQEMALAEARADRAYEQRMTALVDENLDGEELARRRSSIERIHAQQTSDRAKANAARMRQLRLQFESTRLQGIYFPLSRFGDYFVTVRDANGVMLYFDKFENSGARDHFAAQARVQGAKQGWKVSTGLMSNQNDIRGAVDATFMSELEKTLGEHKAATALKDAVWQRYLETLPALSTRKHAIHRKGTAGFNADALRAFGQHMFHASHQLAKLKYGPQLRNTVDLAREEAKKLEDSTQADMLVNELEHRLEWVLNPQGGSAAQKITSAAFLWNLAISPAAALVNWTQTPMLGIPILGAHLGGATRAATALAKASADLTRSKNWHLANGVDGDEKRAMEEFLTRGLLDRTQSHMLAGVGDVGVAYSAAREKWMEKASFLFHHMERINRETTALAAYRMARAKGLDHRAAVDKAIEMTTLVHFDMTNSARARALQSDTAKVLAVHRSHSLNMSYRMLRDAHQMIRGATKEERAIARQTFFGIMGMHALLAGVAGVPFYGVAMVAAGVFKDLLGDEDDERTPEDMLKGAFYDAMPKWMADTLLYGAPSAGSGLSLYNRIGFPDFVFRSPDRELEGRAEFDYWVNQILGPALGMPSSLFNGINNIRKGEFARGVESMLPKGIRDVLKSARYQREGVLTFRGDPVVDDLAAWELIGQGVGFAPFKVSEAYEQRSAKTSLQTRILLRRSRIMNRYALGAKQQDSDMMREAIQDLQKFNRAYPEVAITPDGLRQSVKVRAARSERNQLGGMVLDQRLERRIGQDLGY